MKFRNHLSVSFIEEIKTNDVNNKLRSLNHKKAGTDNEITA